MYIYICTHIIKYPVIPITYSHEYPIKFSVFHG